MKKILIAILLLSILLVACEKTGFASEAERAKVVVEKSELKVCCTYIDDAGEEKTCSILSRYDCDLCDSVCNG